MGTTWPTGGTVQYSTGPSRSKMHRVPCLRLCGFGLPVPVVRRLAGPNWSQNPRNATTLKCSSNADWLVSERPSPLVPRTPARPKPQAPCPKPVEAKKLELAWVVRAAMCACVCEREPRQAEKGDRPRPWHYPTTSCTTPASLFLSDLNSLQPSESNLTRLTALLNPSHIHSSGRHEMADTGTAAQYWALRLISWTGLRRLLPAPR